MDLEDRRSSHNSRSSDFVVRIKSNDNGTFQGNVENIQSGQVQVFRSFIEMCSLIQQKLDQHDFPQKSAEFRSWKEGTDHPLEYGR